MELTDIGANYLREHVPSDVRVSTTLLWDGGVAPNIVPDKAVVWYYMRAFSREVVENVYERLVKVAKGAAMMTETELEIEFLEVAITPRTTALAGVVAEAMNEIPQEPWTQEEWTLRQPWMNRSRTLPGQPRKIRPACGYTFVHRTGPGDLL